MSTSDLVVIRTYNDQFAAKVAKTALEAAGIGCLVRSDDCGGLQPSLWMANGVEVVVRVEDAPRADEVLKSEHQRSSPT